MAQQRLPATLLPSGPKAIPGGAETQSQSPTAFTVLNPNTSYTLQINNGGLTDGEFEKVSSSVIALNGVQIVGPNEFNQNVTLIEKQVLLATNNALSVELRGKPGGGITIQIIGVDNDPPNVTITSPANGAAVSTSPVAVTGTATDAMHLVADLGSPGHTRNDSHIEGDGMETFMGEPINESLITRFDGVDPSVLQVPTGDPVAKVPVARIWDTDTYNGTNPNATASNSVGLAEFTSANFFSDNTISPTTSSDPDLPFPAIDRLSPGPIDIYPPTGNRRQYLSKFGDGVAPIAHMAAEGIFFRFSPPFFFTHVLDDLVYQDYAQKLLPRAIGYSAGLLDYFFRGQVGGNGVQCEFPPPSLFVANLTADEDTGTGVIVALIQYRRVGMEGVFFAVSQTQTVTLTREPQEVTFDFPSFPDSGATDVFTYLIYKGPLGLEEEAVVVGQWGGGLC